MRGQLFLWGIVIYAVMYLVASGLALYGGDGVFSRIVQLAALIIVTVAAARTLPHSHWSDVIPYSIVWMIECAILDSLLAVPYGGWEIYSDWNVWLGYALVVLVPVIVRSTPRISTPAPMT